MQRIWPRIYRCLALAAVLFTVIILLSWHQSKSTEDWAQNLWSMAKSALPTAQPVPATQQEPAAPAPAISSVNSALQDQAVTMKANLLLSYKPIGGQQSELKRQAVTSPSTEPTPASSTAAGSSVKLTTASVKLTSSSDSKSATVALQLKSSDNRSTTLSRQSRLAMNLPSEDATDTGKQQQQQPPVIRLLHQSWQTQELPPLFARWSKSFATCLPKFQRRLWTDADNRQLIATHYPWFLPRFDSYGAGVQKSDVSRLFYMYHYGGVYCDLDCDCLSNFEHLLVNTSLAFGAMDGKMIHSVSDGAYVEEGQIENSFMYSRPRHPFFWNLIKRLNATTVGMPIMTSGPYLIMSGIKDARRAGLDRGNFDGLPYLTIYPPYMFNPYSWIKHNAPACRLFGNFDENSLRRCRQTFENTSFVLQYHSQVWGKGRQNVLERVKL